MSGYHTSGIVTSTAQNRSIALKEGGTIIYESIFFSFRERGDLEQNLPYEFILVKEGVAHRTAIQSTAIQERGPIIYESTLDKCSIK